MAPNSALNVSVGVIAAILVSAAAYQASEVFAPLALALFIIALVWPLQSWLQARMPTLLALAITMVVTVAVCVLLASTVIWSFGRVGRSLLSDYGRYQTLYNAAVAWLEGHGISMAGVWTQHFDVAWLLRAAQQITGRVNTTLSFWLIALVYVILGLMEVDDVRWRVKAYAKPETAHVLLTASAETARKTRKYMEVRTQMSLATGILVGAFAWIVGLQFPLEWGVIAFVLNYIPFVGPFIATLFPTLIEMSQLSSWGSGDRRIRLPERDSVCDRQLYRAARLRRRARHVADGGAVRGFLRDVHLGPIRRLHRRPDRDRHHHLLQPSSIEPLGRRPARRPRKGLRR